MKTNCTVYTKKDFTAFKCVECVDSLQPCIAIMVGGGCKPQTCLIPKMDTEPKWIEISNISTIIEEN